MKIFVTDNELEVGAFGLKSMFGRSGIKHMMGYDNNVTKGIIKTLCTMEGKLVPKSKIPHIDLIDNLCVKILGTDLYYIYAAHPTIENLIHTKHTGGTLHGQMMETNSAVMQVYRQSNGICWYISDRPFESNVLSPITIYNRGSGYFEFYGKDAPIGSDYYIDEFKEW